MFIRKTALTAFFTFLVFGIVLPASVHAQGRGLIRDTEIEDLLRDYSVPIFKAASVNPNSVKVFIINNNALNAFVAGGQRIFVHTGLLEKTKTPNQLIGVLAHETGHIAGGHLAALGQAQAQASTQAIIGSLIGAAATVGGAVAGNGQVAAGGGGLIASGQGFAQRNFLTYIRAQEASADQAAARYLDRTGQSARGMLEVFEQLAANQLASARFRDPYTLTHPLGFERIRNLERFAKQSRNFNKKDPPKRVLRHKLMQAKLYGFLRPRQVLRKYPTRDTSSPAIYARAIGFSQIGDLKASLREIDILLKKHPKNPYFWELKGQILFESGKAAQALTPLKTSLKLAKNKGLIRILYAQTLMSLDNPKSTRQAIKELRLAKRTENNSPTLYRQLAIGYAREKNFPLADLETAEYALRIGDARLATTKATRARKKLKRGSPQWRRANDVLNFIAERRRNARR